MHESNLPKTKNKVKETKNNRNNFETEKTCFDYRETRPSENGQQDGYRRRSWWRQKKNRIKSLRNSHISKSDFAQNFRDSLENRRETRNLRHDYAITFWCLRHFKVTKASTQLSFLSLPSWMPDGKIKFYAAEKIENYSRKTFHVFDECKYYHLEPSPFPYHRVS